MKYERRATYWLRALSYELQVAVMGHEIRDMSYDPRDTRCKIMPGPADDSTVQHLDRSMIVRCRSTSYIDRSQLISDICTGR